MHVCWKKSCLSAVNNIHFSFHRRLCIKLLADLALSLTVDSRTLTAHVNVFGQTASAAVSSRRPARWRRRSRCPRTVTFGPVLPTAAAWRRRCLRAVSSCAFRLESHVSSLLMLAAAWQRYYHCRCHEVYDGIQFCVQSNPTPRVTSPRGLSTSTPYFNVCKNVAASLSPVAESVSSCTKPCALQAPHFCQTFVAVTA